MKGDVSAGDEGYGEVSEGTLAIDFVECQRDSANTKQFEFLELRRDSE